MTFFNALNTVALETDLPEDFEGKATREILTHFNPEEDDYMPVADQLSIMYEAGTYLYDKYPLEEMKKKKFIAQIRPFFPTDDDEALEGKRKLLYNGSGIYKYGKTKYTEFINRYLVPHTIKKIHSADEYDHDGEVPYIEVPKGEYVKVYNFKKFLSYSDNPEETEAIKKFEKEQNTEQNWFDKFNDVIRTIEWKKVALYGIEYENPLYSKEGIGKTERTPNSALRIVSRHSSVNNAAELEFGLQTVTAKQSFLLANNISPILTKPKIDLSRSENIDTNFQIMYPVPMHSTVYPQIYKYTGTNMIIFKVYPLDPQKDVILKAQVSLTECDYKNNCQPYDFQFEQKLPVKSNEIFDNGLDNYFFRASSRIPSAHHKNLELTHFSSNQGSDGQSLYLEFKSNKSVGTFNLFIEDTDGYTTFQEPRIHLQNNRIFVRIIPTEQYKDADLSNAEYLITANLNGQILWQQALVPDKISAASQLQDNFSFVLLLTALFSGFLLNLMPCVFPLLMYYFLSLYYLHKRQAIAFKQRIRALTGGIFCAAILTIAPVVTDKFRNIPFGWGIQLQNMPFIVTMLFAGVLAVKILKRILADTIYTNASALKYIDIGLGIFCWLLALSCGAPYMSEVINTACNSSYLTIILTILAVALGFCLPLLLLLRSETPQTFAVWLNRHKTSVGILIKSSLGVAFVWYLWLIGEQTSVKFIAKMLLPLGIAVYIVSICEKFLQYLNGIFEEKITPEYLHKLRCGTYILILLIFGVLTSVCGWRAQISHKQTFKAKETSFAQTIDEQQIQNDIQQGHSVLVAVNADWCFTCRLNNFLIFNRPNLHKWEQRDKLKFISADISNYNPNIIEYMRKFKTRIDLPFYVLYTPIIRNGIVLQRAPDLGDIDRLLLYNKSTE
ncbi:MAG: hypothetical protein IJ738_05650 [Alphaproteobacteria bacterium]|nr:hypothetical protein [Alphaproteobacteria bacterium]MBR1757029.1 hypothetical protein [Alphaproteobacteria bacterium]